MSEQSGQFARFPTTRWSLVGRAGEQPSDEQRAALNELLKRYWPALKAHLVARRRVDSHRADDFVQGFIENKILERHLVSLADADRGRFRTLLLTALDNYVANRFAAQQAQRRAVDRTVSLDANDPHAAAPEPETDAFDVEWARQLLTETVRRMQAECQVKQRADLWGVFECRLLLPLLEGTEPLAYEALIERFRFCSPTQASNAQITARRMFARILREVVGEYSTSDVEVEEEIQDLQRILAGKHQ